MPSPADVQSKTAKDDHLYAFSPLPQEDSESSLPINMPPTEGGYPYSFSPPGLHLADEISSEFYPSPANEPENIYAKYAKLAFLTLVISYIILTFSLPPPAVVLHPNSFSISNFTIFNSRLAANWEADFTFGCQNCVSNLTSGNDRECNTRIYYDYIKGYIFYNEKEDVLSTVSIEPFSLGAKEHKRVHVKFGNTGWEGNQPIVRKEVVDAIGKKVERGMLHLSMRLDVWVTYKKWGSFWKNNLLGMPDSYCWNLLVGVIPETGMGKLILSRPMKCYQ